MKNTLRNEQPGLRAALDFATAVADYPGADTVGDNRRGAMASTSLCRVLDMLGLAWLATAICALLGFLYVDDLAEQSACFELFRLTLILAVGGFLAARSGQLAQRMRNESCALAQVASAPAPVPLFDDRNTITSAQQPMERAA